MLTQSARQTKINVVNVRQFLPNNQKKLIAARLIQQSVFAADEYPQEKYRRL